MGICKGIYPPSMTIDENNIEDIYGLIYNHDMERIIDATIQALAGNAELVPPFPPGKYTK